MNLLKAMRDLPPRDFVVLILSILGAAALLHSGCNFERIKSLEQRVRDIEERR